MPRNIFTERINSFLFSVVKTAFKIRSIFSHGLRQDVLVTHLEGNLCLIFKMEFKRIQEADGSHNRGELKQSKMWAGELHTFKSFNGLMGVKRFFPKVIHCQQTLRLKGYTFFRGGSHKCFSSSS